MLLSFVILVIYKHHHILTVELDLELYEQLVLSLNDVRTIIMWINKLLVQKLCHKLITLKTTDPKKLDLIINPEHFSVYFLLMHYI